MLACLTTGVAGEAQETGAAAAAGTTSAQEGESATMIKTRIPSPSLDSANDPSSEDNRIGMPLLKHVVLDQRAIWTSPFHLRAADASWLVPFAGLTAGLLVTDTASSRHLPISRHRSSQMNSFSNYGVGALIGAGGGLYFWGGITNDEHKRETGVLSGEAVLNAMVVNTLIQAITRRERPNVNNARGSFGQGGSSFPSDHAAAAWAVAGIIAHEYPGPVPKLFAYGLASSVSMARVLGKQHFQSDALIGSAVGWLVASEVYRTHHNPELAGDSWEPFSWLKGDGHEREPGQQGTPFVPLESWVYRAIERLAAMGYIDTAFLGMRPWTRLECVRLLTEASDRLGEETTGSAEAERIHRALAQEFAGELNWQAEGTNANLQLESIYTRFTGIDGPPLHDSYHFGQTIINDFGRPYAEGANNVTGFSSWGSMGSLAIYVRGEYQYAPSSPAYSDAVRKAIAVADANPVQSATPVATANQFRLLEAYVSENFENWNLSFGKQDLWWGPGDGGALLFSNNAEGIYMFRASRIAPFELPWIFRKLGPMKWDVFFGQLAGNQFPPRPFIHGEKISFKPTPNLEFGFSRTVVQGGDGRPVTIHNILRSYFILTSPKNETPQNAPGKRTGGFEFSYRVPFARKWLTLYADSLATDEPSPLSAPRRSGINSGIYMPRLPGLPKLDLRVEAVYTDPPIARSRGGKYIYFDSFYHDLYTNKKDLIGSWIGREGKGVQTWSTYWFGRQNSLQLGYRHAKVAGDFIPGGETLNDGSVTVNWRVRRDLTLSSFVQYEEWRAPILAPGAHTNWTSSVEIAFSPRWQVR
jgi:membrane-associated phospholipid phosphatase